MRSRHYCRDHPHSANNCPQNARNDRALREIAPFLHCITAPTPHMHSSGVKARRGKASEWHHMICYSMNEKHPRQIQHGVQLCISNINILYLSSFNLSMLCLSFRRPQHASLAYHNQTRSDSMDSESFSTAVAQFSSLSKLTQSLSILLDAQALGVI